MKLKIFLFSIVTLLTSVGVAQLKYEGSVKSIYKTIQLDDGSFKYMKYNKENNEVLIYSLDKSLWRTVKLPLPKHHELDEIKHLSIYTFNKDEYVELVYSCAVYSIQDNLEDPEKDILNVHFTINIINELGEKILIVPNSSEIEFIDSNGKKSLFIYKNVGKLFSDKNVTLIYSF
jgi:hypothetical protein